MSYQYQPRVAKEFAKNIVAIFWFKLKEAAQHYFLEQTFSVCPDKSAKL